MMTMVTKKKQTRQHESESEEEDRVMTVARLKESERQQRGRQEGKQSQWRNEKKV